MSADRPIRFVHLWPLAFLAVVGAGVYFVLMITLRGALSVEGDYANLMPLSSGGPSILFALVAGILGWASVALIERRLSTAGPVVWLYAAVVWGTAAAIGFMLAALVLANNVDMVLTVGICCAVVSAVVAGWFSWTPLS